MSDPNEQCGNCHYFNPGSRIENHQRSDQCRVNPPTLHPVPVLREGQQGLQMLTLFPAPNANDWCGEWDNGMNGEPENAAIGGETRDAV